MYYHNINYDSIFCEGCFFTYFNNCVFENIDYIGDNLSGDLTFDNCNKTIKNYI